MRALKSGLGVCALLLWLGANDLWAEKFLTPNEAERLIFPKGTRFEPRVIELTAPEVKAVENASGAKVRTRTLTIRLARDGTNLAGVVFIDQVLGKHELIIYAVGVTPDGRVEQVEILEYREKYGGDIRREAWRRQFKGRTARDPLKLDGDISNISGATISSRNVTAGIKRLLATYEEVVRPRLRAARELPDAGRP